MKKTIELELNFNCHDCGANIGSYHSENCDSNYCVNCLGQIPGCECGKDIEMPYMGVHMLFLKIIAITHEKYSKMESGKGWVPCKADDKNSSPDLNWAKMYWSEHCQNNWD